MACPYKMHKIYIHTLINKGSVLTLHLDDNGNLLNTDAAKWARSIARKWGIINSQEKVKANGIPGWAWNFSCSGHGGYVLIARKTEVPNYFSKFMEDGYVYDVYISQQWVPLEDPQYKGYAAFVFEEDCNWAIFEITYPDVSRWAAYVREQDWATSGSLDQERALLAKRRLNNPEEMDLCVKERKESALKSALRWQDIKLLKVMQIL